MITSELDWEALFVAARRWAIQHDAFPDTEEDIAQEAVLKLYLAVKRGASYAPRAAFAAIHQSVKWLISDQRTVKKNQAIPLFDAVPDTCRHESLPWAWIRLAQDPHEYATMLSLAWGQQPGEQLSQWPGLFADVKEIYRVRHRLAERFRKGAARGPKATGSRTSSPLHAGRDARPGNHR